jgi:hypothetical protein
MAPLDDGLNRWPVTLENRLDAAVRRIPDPAANFSEHRRILGIGPEIDTLHVPGYPHMSAYAIRLWLISHSPSILI